MKSKITDTGATYEIAGVDTERAEQALNRMIPRLQETWPAKGQPGAVQLPIGFFANVIDFQGIGLAISGDGVGTKALIAQMMNKYDTIGIDCVAMNVNDILCVGARPVTMIDYLAVEEPDPRIMDEITAGLCAGAKEASVSISGGETAQMKDVIKGYRPGTGFDLAGTAVGIVELDKIIVGQDIREGDALIAIESSGIHSNGLSLARRVFFDRCALAPDAPLRGLAGSLGEELLRPTNIYVGEVMDLLEGEVRVKALIHITGDGLLNLVRVMSDAGFVIDKLPPIPRIFELIQEYGEVADEEMFQVFNMGIGFCIAVARDDTERALSIVQSRGRKAYAIGHAVLDLERRVWVKPRNLVSAGKSFKKA